MKIIPTYKIVIVGDGGVGKTTLMKYMLDGGFTRPYVATLGVEVHPLYFETNYGPIQFNCWDTAGQEKFGGLKDGYFIQADGALVMFDVGSRITFKNLNQHVRNVRRTAGEIPMIFVGNKCDLESRKINEGPTGQAYYDLSIRNGFNVSKPFLYLARKVTGYEDLVFLELPQ